MSSIPSHILRSDPIDTPPRRHPRTPPSPYKPVGSFEEAIFEDIEEQALAILHPEKKSSSSPERDSWEGYSFDHLRPKPKRRKRIPDFPFSPSSSSISGTSSGSSCFSSRAGSKVGSYDAHSKEPQELQDPHSFKTKLSSELATVEQKHSAEFSESSTESRLEKATASIFSDNSKKENYENIDSLVVKKTEGPISNSDGKKEASDSESDSEDDCMFPMD